ncbi:MAG: CPBP family intramembrane glutamic endopeptidase [Terriglobales bacterium]
MAGTLMDTTPLPPSAPEPSPPDPAVVAMLPPVPAVTASAHRESPVSPLFDVFVGPHGIYPGVRWLIYLSIGYILFRLLGDLMHDLHPQPGGPIWWGMITEGFMMLAAIVPGFILARIERRPFGDFGLPARSAFRRNFWVGTLWGIASLSVLMLALRLAGAFEFGSLALHGASVVKFAVYYAVFFLLTGLFEEFLVRGYSQWVLSQGMNFWPAAALLSASFGALHSTNPGESKAGLIAAALIGFFFCLTLRRTGDLWWAIGFHMSWDWGESYLYSVPDSGGMSHGHLLNSSFHGPEWLTGGSVGPEGSLLVFVVIVALWVLFDRMYPEVKYQA